MTVKMGFFKRLSSTTLVLVTALLVLETESLDMKGEGVCVARLSFRESRMRANKVIVTKWCGKKKCKERKSVPQYYTTWRTRAVCCNGWQHNGQRDICEPICSTGCNNGKCVAPNICQCDPPLHLHLDRINTCIPYECDPPCSNADCWENTCKCYSGYEKYNSTHCMHCDEGFIVDSDATCKPKCEHKCVNGTCTTPNSCTCLRGYKRKDNYECEPICDCVNGSCVAPGTCSCFDGYTALNSTHCIPKCDDCANGVCVAPNDCKCNIGFAKINGSCAAVCSEACVNSVCTAPNVCSCFEGYQKDEERWNLCFKPCRDCKGVCDQHGVCNGGRCLEKFKEARHRTRLTKCKDRPCVKNEIYYVTKQKETCCVGWQWVQAYNTCTPRCMNGCINGTCVAPEVCQCNLPLVLKKNTCLLPICDPPCSANSRCTADNTCSCDDNFFSINATHCAPTCLTGYVNDPIECKAKCDKTCVNATCTAPNTCTCIEGHRMLDNNTCIPECNPTCENAECVAPKTCQCFDGFIKENSSKCIPKCDRCENGDCVAPNTCKCHEGYKMKDGICIPNCDHPCINGICSAPNTCSCNLGYKLSLANKYNCLPICEPACLNASCVSPNTCSCLTGYYMTGNNWTCSPRCDNCENGECVAPNNCRCYIGYTKDENKCRPKCDKVCKNGVCSKPNECTCNVGFAIDKMDKFHCKPICRDDCVNSTCVSPGKCQCLPGYESTIKENICKPKCVSCIHGQCVSPDVCQCDVGYYMSNGVCLPICSSPCMNGYCSSPETCSCEAGFRNKLDEPHICYKECIGLCNNGKCTLEGECICDRGFDLLNDTCVEKKPVDCDTCNCTDGDCWCLDGSPCLLAIKTHSDEVITTTSLAGLELTWVLGGALGLLMLILLMAIIIQMSRRKFNPENKTTDNGVVYGSVIYTAPNRLMTSRPMYENGVTQEDTLYEEVPSKYHEEEEEVTNDLLNRSQQQHD